MPHFRNPLDAQVQKVWHRRDVTLEEVHFQGRYGERIPALIAYSDLARARPLPVLLCMPGTPNVKEDFLHRVDILRPWADRGFFTMSIDRPYHGARAGELRASTRDKGLLKVWGESVYDLMRALDYAESRPEADGARVGMLGLSMGGMEAMLLAAIDARVDVVVSVAGQLVWRDIFHGEAWKRIFRGMELRHELVRRGARGAAVHQAFLEDNPGLEHVDAERIAPRLAPRPLLLIVGADDPYIPLQAARHAYQAARTAYAAAGQRERLRLREVRGAGHSFSETMQEEALAWFIRWLLESPAADGG